MTTRSAMKGKNKRPLETTLGRAPPAQKSPDLSHVRKPIETSIFGLQHVLQLLETSTAEVQNYISYECEIMYECRICRTIFRSLANFILHKRNYCTEKYSTLALGYCKSNGQFVVDDDHIDVNERHSRSSTPDSQRDTKNKKLISPVIDKLVEKHKVKEIAREALQEDLSIDSSKAPVAEYDGDMCLEKIRTTDSAVFQTMLQNFSAENKRSEFMKSQVMEIHSILESDEAVLGPDGKICNFETSKKREQTNLPKSDLVCTECNLKFSTRKTLTYHIKYKHNATRIVYPCPDCKELFANAWCVYRHLYKVHRKTSAQIKRLRDVIHNSAVRKDQQPAKKKEKKQVQEKTDDDNQWLKNVEGDNDIQMCGGCGKRFERKAALYSHSQMCIKRIAVCNNIKEGSAKPKSDQEEKMKDKMGKSEKDVRIVKGSRKRKPSHIISYKVFDDGKEQEPDIFTKCEENYDQINTENSENESIQSSYVDKKPPDSVELAERKRSHTNSSQSTDDEEEQYSCIDALDTESMMNIIGIPSKCYQENTLVQGDQVEQNSQKLKSSNENTLRNESLKLREAYSNMIDDEIKQEPDITESPVDDGNELVNFKSESESYTFSEINEATDHSLANTILALNKQHPESQLFQSSIDKRDSEDGQLQFHGTENELKKAKVHTYHTKQNVMRQNENDIAEGDVLSSVEKNEMTPVNKLPSEIDCEYVEKKNKTIISAERTQTIEECSSESSREIEDVKKIQQKEINYPSDTLKQSVLEKISMDKLVDDMHNHMNIQTNIFPDELNAGKSPKLINIRETKHEEKAMKAEPNGLEHSSAVLEKVTLKEGLTKNTDSGSDQFIKHTLKREIIPNLPDNVVPLNVCIKKESMEASNNEQKNKCSQLVKNLEDIMKVNELVEPQMSIDKEQIDSSSDYGSVTVKAKKSCLKKTRRPKNENKIMKKSADKHGLNVMGEDVLKNNLSNPMENVNACIENNFTATLGVVLGKNKFRKPKNSRKTKVKVDGKQVKYQPDPNLECENVDTVIENKESDSHTTVVLIDENSINDQLSLSKPELGSMRKNQKPENKLDSSSNKEPNILDNFEQFEMGSEKTLDSPREDAEYLVRDTDVTNNVDLDSAKTDTKSISLCKEVQEVKCNILLNDATILFSTGSEELNNGDTVTSTFPDHSVNKLDDINQSIDISCNVAVTSDDTSLDTGYTDINISDTTYVNNDESEYVCILDTIAPSNVEESLVLEDALTSVTTSTDDVIENPGAQLFSDLETVENRNMKQNVAHSKDSNVLHKLDGTKSPDVIIINDDDSDTVQNEDNIEYIINSHSESDEYENECHKELEETPHSIPVSPQTLKRRRTLSLDYISQCPKKKVIKLGEEAEGLSGDDDVNFISKASPYMNQGNLSCISCDIIFPKLSKLLWHMSQHFSWFRFQCSRCSYMSFNKLDCVNHARKVHYVPHNSLNCIVLPIPNWKTVLMSHEFCYLNGPKNARNSQEGQSCTETDVHENINCEELSDIDSFGGAVDITSSIEPDGSELNKHLEPHSCSSFESKSHVPMCIEVLSSSSSSDDSDINLRTTGISTNTSREGCTNATDSEFIYIKPDATRIMKNIKLTKSKDTPNHVNSEQQSLNEDLSKNVRPVRNRVRSVKTLQSDFIYDLHNVLQLNSTQKEKTQAKYKRTEILKKNFNKSKSNSCKTLRVYSKTPADSDKIKTNSGDMNTEV